MVKIARSFRFKNARPSLHGESGARQRAMGSPPTRSYRSSEFIGFSLLPRQATKTFFDRGRLRASLTQMPANSGAGKLHESYGYLTSAMRSTN